MWDPDGRKVDIVHATPCRCWIDGQAVYVVAPCRRIGHWVTKHRILQLLHKLRRP
jgi:hypothetical protein